MVVLLSQEIRYNVYSYLQLEPCPSTLLPINKCNMNITAKLCSRSSYIVLILQICIIHFDHFLISYIIFCNSCISAFVEKFQFHTLNDTQINSYINQQIFVTLMVQKPTVTVIIKLYH